MKPESYKAIHNHFSHVFNNVFKKQFKPDAEDNDGFNSYSKELLTPFFEEVAEKYIKKHKVSNSSLIREDCKNFIEYVATEDADECLWHFIPEDVRRWRLTEKEQKAEDDLKRQIL